MKRKKSVVVFIVFLAIVVLLGYYAFGILKGTMNKDGDAGIELGLDLSGGVSITYQVEGDETPSSTDMSDTIYKLQQRVENYSTEAHVYQVGDDRITAEIPGVTNANEILEELGSPGSLEFQTPDGEVFMTGTDVVNAEAETQEDDTGNSEFVVTLTLSDEAAEIFAEITEEYLYDELPIYFDDELISNPTVQAVISDGTAVISGMDSYEEAEELASTIRIGSLSLELTELESQVVGAQLGSDAIRTSIYAAIIGVLIVMAFMIVIYWVPGVAAAIALTIYAGIVLALLHLYDVTLTLPGIAGIILSIGMAVDANVIIFARIREETANGRTVEQAIKTGFKRAQSAILDGNITTLIAAAVLGLRGSGSVRGFAITLAIGVAVSLFTSLFITRWILKAMYGMGIQNVKYYGKKKERKPIDFIRLRKITFIIPVVLIVIGCVSMGVRNNNSGNPLNFSLEFVGGTSTTVEFEEDYTLEEIDDEIVPKIEDITGSSDIQTQKVEDSSSVIFKTGTLSLEQRTELTELMEEDYGVEESGITYTSISSTISAESRQDAMWAVIIATICMLIYIWFRFKNIRFAAAAIIALLHDVLILLMFYAVSWTSVGTTFIACMLTILGYSINSTIVIFDRIRENYNNDTIRTDDDLKNTVNKSITQTLGRSFNTNITSLITLVCLFILGVSSIRDFSGPLIVGIIAGVYSSILITGPLWYTFFNRFRKGAKKGGSTPPQKSSKKKKKKKTPQDKLVV